MVERERPRGIDRTGAEARFSDVVRTLGRQSGVAQSVKKGFGFGGLLAGGKLFAVPRGEGLLLKLPAAKVAALIATGEGEVFDAGKGRPMKEWVVVGPRSQERWLELARQAMSFVAGGPGARRKRG